MKEVIVVIGPGQIGKAIARRVGFGKHLVVADMRQDNAKAAATVLQNASSIVISNYRTRREEIVKRFQDHLRRSLRWRNASRTDQPRDVTKPVAFSTSA